MNDIPSPTTLKDVEMTRHCVTCAHSMPQHNVCVEGPPQVIASRWTFTKGVNEVTGWASIYPPLPQIPCSKWKARFQ